MILEQIAAVLGRRVIPGKAGRPKKIAMEEPVD